MVQAEVGVQQEKGRRQSSEIIKVFLEESRRRRVYVRTSSISASLAALLNFVCSNDSKTPSQLLSILTLISQQANKHNNFCLLK